MNSRMRVAAMLCRLAAAVCAAHFCILGPARAEEALQPLSAADFRMRVWRGFTLDELSAVTPENFSDMARLDRKSVV